MIFLFYTVLFMTITSADQQVNLFLPIKKARVKDCSSTLAFIESHVDSFVFKKQKSRASFAERNDSAMLPGII